MNIKAHSNIVKIEQYWIYFAKVDKGCVYNWDEDSGTGMKRHMFGDVLREERVEISEAVRLKSVFSVPHLNTAVDKCLITIQSPSVLAMDSE